MATIFLRKCVASISAAATLVSALGAPFAQAQGMTTQGSFAVSPSGAATYNIPIAVPPGVAGMEPRLSLNYNSQGGNGLLGMGWSLGGLSAITRCPQTMAQDGARGGVNYDANDRFCMDGQRLMVVAGTYGAAGSEYRTEMENFSRITFDGNAFKVQSKAGLTMEYGNTADSRIEAQGKAVVKLWALGKITDIAGNYLTVTYQEDNANGDFRPARIDYTGNAGQAPTASVQFDYETRLDIVPMYQAGSVNKTMQRLAKVKTYVGTTQVKEYRLAYAAQTGAIDRSKLNTVTECDGGGVCLPGVALNWSPSSASLLDSSYTFPNGWNFGNGESAHMTRMGDFNNDGKMDFIRIGPTVAYTFLSNGNGTFTPTAYTYPNGWNFNTGESVHTLAIGDFNGDGFLDFLRVGPTVAYSFMGTGNGTFTSSSYAFPNGWNFGNGESAHMTRMGDFNNDGKMDFIRIGPTVAYTFLSNGNGTYTPTSYTYPNGWNFNTGESVHTLAIGDFNGDGFLDFLRVGPTVAYSFMGTGNGTFTSSSYAFPNGWNFGNGESAHMTRMGDFNNDGKIDFIRIGPTVAYTFLSNGNGAYTPTSYTYPNGWNFNTGESVHTLAISDFNGDGFLDFLRVGPTVAYSFMGTGNGTFTSSSYAFPNGWNFGNGESAHMTRMGDFNNDGKIDFIRIGPTVAYTFLSNGNGAYTPTSYTYPNGWNFNTGESVHTLAIGDFNGDAKTDFLRIGPTVAYAFASDGTASGLVNQVLTNGLITTVNNISLAQSTNLYVKDSQSIYPIIDIIASMHVVSSVQTSNGIGGSNTVNYQYGGLKAELGKGRGMLGFRWMKS